jgi:hypothetical protein
MTEPKIDHLSSSQLNIYLMCSLKYRFQYVDRIPRTFKSSGLAFGSVIHSTIDWFHKKRMKKLEVPLEDLYRIMESDWYCQKCEDEIRFKEGEDENKLLAMARNILSLYYHSPINGIVQTEFPFRIPLINPKTKENLGIPLEGYIDLIETDDVITEFKNTAKAIDPDSLDDMLQLTTYSYAYRMIFGKEPQKLKIINFVKTRTPKVNVMEAGARNNEDYSRFFHLTKEVLRGIRSSIYFPRQSFLCKDCEYEIPCRAWQGNGQKEAA